MNALDSFRPFGDVLRGDKVAFEMLDGRFVTFGEFNERVDRLANAAATMGVAKGDRVAILAKSRPEYAEVFGLSKTGAIVVPLNWRLASAELAKLIRHSAPMMLIVDKQHRELVEILRDEIEGVDHTSSCSDRSVQAFRVGRSDPA